MKLRPWIFNGPSPLGDEATVRCYQGPILCPLWVPVRGCRCMYIGSITTELHLWGLFLVPSVSICPGAVFSILWRCWSDVCLHPRVCRLLLSDRNEQPRSGMPPPAEWDHCWLRWGKREPQKFTIVNKHPCCCSVVLFIVTNICTYRIPDCIINTDMCHLISLSHEIKAVVSPGGPGTWVSVRLGT